MNIPLLAEYIEDYLNSFRIKKIMKFKGIRNVEFFAKGKRGRVFTGNYNGKKVAVKLYNFWSDYKIN